MSGISHPDAGGWQFRVKKGICIRILCLGWAA
jgi:hypothetical protein